MEEERMTLEEFCQLSIDHGALHAWVYGNMLTFQSENDFIYYLYHVENFYVEVVYNKQTNKIEWVEGFKDTEFLSLQ